ncbi:uncharacterized protein [Temnothorax nylanderi]|uniref:uncharacterized protein isoform X3 n=1 Tax=Temnothorax nylanderi TaxID=102681 RepID=UPI003A841F43
MQNYMSGMGTIRCAILENCGWNYQGYVWPYQYFTKNAANPRSKPAILDQGNVNEHCFIGASAAKSANSHRAGRKVAKRKIRNHDFDTRHSCSSNEECHRGHQHRTNRAGNIFQ